MSDQPDPKALQAAIERQTEVELAAGLLRQGWSFTTKITPERLRLWQLGFTLGDDALGGQGATRERNVTVYLYVLRPFFVALAPLRLKKKPSDLSLFGRALEAALEIPFVRLVRNDADDADDDVYWWVRSEFPVQQLTAPGPTLLLDTVFHGVQSIVAAADLLSERFAEDLQPAGEVAKIPIIRVAAGVPVH